MKSLNPFSLSVEIYRPLIFLQNPHFVWFTSLREAVMGTPSSPYKTCTALSRSGSDSVVDVLVFGVGPEETTR